MERLNVNFSGQIVPVKPINTELTLCKCYVMALGKNQNLTEFTKEAVDDALPTLFNIPVVGHLIVDDDGSCRIGGHDMTLEKGNDGTYKFKTLTVPYGTVPQQDNVHYEEVVEDDGQVTTYVVADVILWTGRYPEILQAVYDEKTYFAQSMEIDADDIEDDGQYMKVNKFQFSALCLLGKSDNKLYDIKPCFPSACVEPYKFSATAEWTKLFDEFKAELAETYSDNSKGGKGEVEDEIKTEEVIVEQLQVVETNPQVFEPPVTEVSPAVELPEEDIPEEELVEEPKKFEVDLTYKEKADALCRAIQPLCIWEAEAYADYWLVDFTDKFAYIAHHVCAPDKCEEGVDKVPYTIADGEAMLSMQEAKPVKQVWLTAEDEAKLAEEKEMFEALRQFKADRIEEDRRKEFAGIAEEFSDLAELDEYKNLVANMLSYSSVEELKKEFYALRGMYSKKPAKKPVSQMRIPVGKTGNILEPKTDVDAFMAHYSRK